MATIHDKLVFALEQYGYQIDPAAITRKYTVLRHPGKALAYFIGKSGACRRGDVATFAWVAENSKAELLAAWDIAQRCGGWPTWRGTEPKPRPKASDVFG